MGEKAFSPLGNQRTFHIALQYIIAAYNLNNDGICYINIYYLYIILLLSLFNQHNWC